MKHGKSEHLMFSIITLQLDAHLISKHNTKTPLTATQISKISAPSKVILSKIDKFLMPKNTAERWKSKMPA